MENHEIEKSKRVGGFSLIELIIALAITLFIVSICLVLLAESLHQKVREDSLVSALADGNQGLKSINLDLINAGMSLNGNGIVAANSGKNFIRIRSNLNAFLKQTTSNAVTDDSEDVVYMTVAGEKGKCVLAKLDVNSGTSNILATEIDNTDIDNDGAGDGLKFSYLDADGNEVTAANAAQVRVTLRIILPQLGTPNSPGYKPKTILPLSSKIFLRNSNLLKY